MDGAGSIVLFDGECNLCNGTVQFLLPRDKAGRLKFASLQSEAGARLLDAHGIATEDRSSIVFVEGEACYTQSSAVLRIARKLSGAWPLLGVFLIVPKFLRDGAYSFIAKRRHRWFGRPESCFMPGPGTEERFLE